MMNKASIESDQLQGLQNKTESTASYLAELIYRESLPAATEDKMIDLIDQIKGNCASSRQAAKDLEAVVEELDKDRSCYLEADMGSGTLTYSSENLLVNEIMEALVEAVRLVGGVKILNLLQTCR